MGRTSLLVVALLVAASGYSIPPQTGRRWTMRRVDLAESPQQEREESVHLKLQDLSSVLSSNPPRTPERKNRTNDVVIHEYVSLEGTTLLACVGGQNKLEHFSNHVFGSNYTANASVLYSQIVMDEGDEALVAKYVSLWKEGRYLSRSKSIRSDWKDSGAEGGRTSLQDTVLSNTARIKVRLRRVSCVVCRMSYVVCRMSYVVWLMADSRCRKAETALFSSAWVPLSPNP
jgi:hypothetical protein